MTMLTEMLHNVVTHGGEIFTTSDDGSSGGAYYFDKDDDWRYDADSQFIRFENDERIVYLYIRNITYIDIEKD